MEKIYVENIKLTAIRNKLFSNLSDKKHVSIFEVFTLSSGDYLPTNKLIDGEFDVYGGGGTTAKKHNEYNIETETFGIGRVGARCGCVFKIRPKSWVTDNALYATKIDVAFDIEFLIHYLNFKNLNQFANTAAQPVISLKRISGISIPIIDLKLQKEIVEILNGISNGFLIIDDDKFGIQQTLNFVTSKEKLSTELTHQITLVKKLRQQLLQDAVQGKLVEQNKKDEPASELLKKIKAERLNWVGFQPDSKKEIGLQSNKIKEIGLKPTKSSNHSSGLKPRAIKELPPIKPEEIPFEIPENWVWCRLGEMVNIKSGKRIHASDYRPSGVPFLRSGEIGSLGRGENLKTELYISESKYQEVKQKFGIPKAGDILIACIGGSIGNTWIVDEREFYFKDGNLVLIETIPFLNKDFLLSYLKSPFFWNNTILNATDSSYNALTIVKLNDAEFPLPPLAEQNRIVQKLDELMQYCNELEASIKQSEIQNEKLLQQVLREALRKEPVEV